MSDGPEVLLALAGMFHGPDRTGVPSLEDDVAAACEDPGHEPAHASVRIALALFPGLAPSAAPRP